MTNRVNPLRQLAIGSVAVLTTALTFGATVTPAPAYAQSGAYYRATLQQPVEKRTEIIRGGTFICSGTVCVGTKARSRPELVCKKLAGEFGPIASFSVTGTKKVGRYAAGKDVDEATLASCKTEEA